VAPWPSGPLTSQKLATFVPGGRTTEWESH
jgi:hypothetical protein